MRVDRVYFYFGRVPSKGHSVFCCFAGCPTFLRNFILVKPCLQIIIWRVKNLSAGLKCMKTLNDDFIPGFSVVCMTVGMPFAWNLYVRTDWSLFYVNSPYKIVRSLKIRIGIQDDMQKTIGAECIGAGISLIKWKIIGLSDRIKGIRLNF